MIFQKEGDYVYQELIVEMVRKGVSQKELAQLIGMSESALSLRLSGKVNLLFSEAVKIKKALNSQLHLEVLFEKKDD